MVVFLGFPGKSENYTPQVGELLMEYTNLAAAEVKGNPQGFPPIEKSRVNLKSKYSPYVSNAALFLTNTPLLSGVVVMTFCEKKLVALLSNSEDRTEEAT